MPNWCYNDMCVVGEEHEIKKFMKDFQTSPQKVIDLYKADGEKVPSGFLLANLYPREPINVEHWGAWCREHWGTKWDIKSGSVDSNYYNGCFNITFSTAWNPPIGWLEYVSKQYPNLKFVIDYNEPGNLIKGLDEFRNGLIRHEESYEFPIK